MPALDRVRELIRAEVARFHPAEESRRALELIVETSLRYEERDGALNVTVIDNDGRPRTKVENHRTVGLTIADLVAELRREHPKLFRAAAAPPPPSGETGAHPSAEPPPARAGAAATAAAAPVSSPAASGDGLAASAHGSGSPMSTAATAGAARESVPHTASAPARDVLSLGPPREEPAPAGFFPEPGGAPPSAIRGRFQAGALRLGAFVGAAAERVAGRGAARPRKADVFRSEGPVPGRRFPRLSGRAALSLVAVALLVPLGGILGLSLVRDARHPPEASAAAAVRTMNEPEATGAVPGQDPAPAGASALRGVAEVLDTATLSIQGKVVRLFGVEWAKGGGEPDDLARYLRGREVTCRLEGGSDKHRCEVQGQDLSRVVLFNGGGRATPEATPDLKAAEEHARGQQRGLWGAESLKAKP